jgi:hypothetical protein
MSTENQALPGRWGQRKRDIATIVWVSFLAACAGTFVIFAVMDPDSLSDAWVLPWEMGRKLAYGLGFFFLFVVSFIASSLTIFMVRTGPAQGHVSGKGRRPPTQLLSPDDNNPDLDLRDLK